MVTRIGGNRRKTRSLFKKNYRQQGKVSIQAFLQSFKVGDKVLLKAETAVQHGMYFRRFHGNVGEVIGQQGACYKVRINDQGKPKTVIVHPVHLKK